MGKVELNLPYLFQSVEEGDIRRNMFARSGFIEMADINYYFTTVTPQPLDQGEHESLRAPQPAR